MFNISGVGSAIISAPKTFFLSGVECSRNGLTFAKKAISTAYFDLHSSLVDNKIIKNVTLAKGIAGLAISLICLTIIGIPILLIKAYRATSDKALPMSEKTRDLFTIPEDESISSVSKTSPIKKEKLNAKIEQNRAAILTKIDRFLALRGSPQEKLFRLKEEVTGPHFIERQVTIARELKQIEKTLSHRLAKQARLDIVKQLEERLQAIEGWMAGHEWGEEELEDKASEEKAIVDIRQQLSYYLKNGTSDLKKSIEEQIAALEDKWEGDASSKDSFVSANSSKE